MGIEKISISLPSQIAEEIDLIAEEEGKTRSGVVREAALLYISNKRSKEAEKQRQDRIQRAIDGFEELARQWGPDDRTSVELLRELRDEESR